MATKGRNLNSGSSLAILLLTLAGLVLASLYLDLRQQYARLEQENRRLTDSQVLLMVPDEQAVALTEWLESHPRQTQGLLERATASNEAGGQPMAHNLAAQPAMRSEVISEKPDGVKIIALPHGGIRVTTRDENTH